MLVVRERGLLSVGNWRDTDVVERLSSEFGGAGGEDDGVVEGEADAFLFLCGVRGSSVVEGCREERGRT